MPADKIHHGRSLRRRAALVTLAALLAAGSTARAQQAIVHPSLWPERAATHARTDTESFVDSLLAHMSLEEKVAQMIQADIASLKPEDLRIYKLGAVLAGGGSGR